MRGATELAIAAVAVTGGAVGAGAGAGGAIHLRGAAVVLVEVVGGGEGHREEPWRRRRHHRVVCHADAGELDDPSFADQGGQGARLHVGGHDPQEREQAELLTRTKQTLAKLNASHNTNKDPAIERQRQQLINLLAQIEKRIQEENARPRKRYVSPSTQEVSYARYYDVIRRKIEAKGTLDFPQSQGQKLYGSLIMVITIDTRGHVISAEVSQGSGNPLLDFHAKQIARNAAPYGPFNEVMRREMDQLALVTRFSFDHNNTLQTTLQGE